MDTTIRLNPTIIFKMLSKLLRIMVENLAASIAEKSFICFVTSYSIEFHQYYFLNITFAPLLEKLAR